MAGLIASFFCSCLILAVCKYVSLQMQCGKNCWDSTCCIPRYVAKQLGTMSPQLIKVGKLCLQFQTCMLFCLACRSGCTRSNKFFSTSLFLKGGFHGTLGSPSIDSLLHSHRPMPVTAFGQTQSTISSILFEICYGVAIAIYYVNSISSKTMYVATN